MVNWLLFNLQTINFWYATAGLGLLAVTFVLLYDLYGNDQKLYKQWVSPYVWSILILATIGGVSSTLLYSEVFGFVPCSLCWLQRIGLYPQVLLVLAAFKLKDVKHFPVYGIVISTFGLLAAIYHYIYQQVPKELHESGLVPCLTDGTADCADKIMNVYGFVTFPFLSGIMFLFLITLYLHVHKANKQAY